MIENKKTLLSLGPRGTEMASNHQCWAVIVELTNKVIMAQSNQKTLSSSYDGFFNTVPISEIFGFNYIKNAITFAQASSKVSKISFESY